MTIYGTDADVLDFNNYMNCLFLNHQHFKGLMLLGTTIILSLNTEVELHGSNGNSFFKHIFYVLSNLYFGTEQKSVLFPYAYADAEFKYSFAFTNHYLDYSDYYTTH